MGGILAHTLSFLQRSVEWESERNSVFVCVNMCIRERERERHSQVIQRRNSKIVEVGVWCVRERERVYVCVVCVCLSERERDCECVRMGENEFVKVFIVREIDSRWMQCWIFRRANGCFAPLTLVKILSFFFIFPLFSSFWDKKEENCEKEDNIKKCLLPNTGGYRYMSRISPKRVLDFVEDVP